MRTKLCKCGCGQAVTGPANRQYVSETHRKRLQRFEIKSRDITTPAVLGHSGGQNVPAFDRGNVPAFGDPRSAMTPIELQAEIMRLARTFLASAPWSYERLLLALFHMPGWIKGPDGKTDWSQAQMDHTYQTPP
jgi:hypothetical protein